MANLKFFFLSMDPDTVLELVKQGVTLLLLDVPQQTLLSIDTHVLLLILYSSFFFSLLLIFIHQSINQCGRCFLLGLLLRASSWFLLLLIFFIIVHPPGYFNFQKSSCSCNLFSYCIFMRFLFVEQFCNTCCTQRWQGFLTNYWFLYRRCTFWGLKCIYFISNFSALVYSVLNSLRSL